MIRLHNHRRHTVLVKADDVSVAVDVRGGIGIVLVCMRMRVRMGVPVLVCVLMCVLVRMGVLMCMHMLVVLSFFLSAHTYLASELQNLKTLYTYFIYWYIASTKFK